MEQNSKVVLHEVREGEDGVRLIGCVREATLFPVDQLEGGDSLQGLPARVLVVESTVFLATQLVSLKHQLATLLDNTQAIERRAPGIFDHTTYSSGNCDCL